MIDLSLSNATAKFAQTLEKVERDVIGRKRVALFVAALELERSIKEELSRPGTGNAYRRGKRTHIASAPGRPPAVDTGRLRNSITHGEDSPGVVRVGTNVEYAARLEYGEGTLEARPYMRPAFKRVEARLKGIVVAPLRGGRGGA